MGKYPPDVQQLAPQAPLFDGSQACEDADTELFFPPQGGMAPVVVRAAKSICATCRFLAPCLNYALAHNVEGVWGGTTEGERRAIRRGRGHIRHVAAAS